MRSHWKIQKLAKLAVIVIPVFALFIYLVMRLWNWLVPDLFGLHPVTYWQMVGILVLSKILFGGFPCGSSGPSLSSGRRIMERWEQMSPEEREKFRQGLRDRWCPPGPPATPAS